MSDVRDLRRARRGDSGVAFERLYETEAPRLLRYFRRRTDGHVASDLVQDAFVRLAAIGRVGQLANPAAYLQRIARNLLADHARVRAARKIEPLALEDRDIAVDATQEDGLIASDLLRLYEQVIGALPERTRQIFLLQRVDGLTYRQIAGRLDVTLWTVEHHMKQAIAHIDRSLDER